MSTFLIIDTDHLCHRAFHSTGELSFRDVFVGVIYGVLRDIANFHDLHSPDQILFCFDYGLNCRTEKYPKYKCSRRIKRKAFTPAERQTFREFRRQVHLLRTTYLKAIGYRNIFYQDGYEADDIIASLVRDTLGVGDEAIIVSSDKDLYQLLSGTVRLWNPRTYKSYTVQSLHQEYGLRPERWAEVKALAGCPTDDVVGIRGIGEKTAAKFLRDELDPDTKAYTKILKGFATYEANLELVTLPYPGTKKFKIREDEVTVEKWERLTKQLGMRSLRDSAPVPSKTFRRRRKK